MTHLLSKENVVIITPTAPAKCADCGEAKGLRPYGKDGAWVCFPCGMKDEPEAEKQFEKLFTGERDI